MQNRLFRQVALERLSTPERLDELMQVTTPKGWLGMLAMWAVLLVVLLWSIFGSLPTVVTGQGILIRDGSILGVESPASGQVFDLFVNVGDQVQQDQVVARVVQQGDASREGGTTSRTVFVTSQYAGRVLELRVNRGSVIQAGTALLSVEVPGRTLEAILYLSPLDGKNVQTGMQVQIAPAPVRPEEYGRLLGRVTSVGDLPATAPAMRRVLGSDELVKTMSANGAPVEVRVDLTRSPSTTSGYAWTSTVGGSLTAGASALIGPALRWAPEWVGGFGLRPGGSLGPPIRLETGTFCQADIIVDEQSPISLVFAKLDR
jgi:hypothetical protein